MARAQPGEVWMADLGLAAKVRLCLILSNHPADDELTLVIIIPHATAIRGNRWELALPKPFLKPGVFDLQQIQPILLRICLVCKKPSTSNGKNPGGTST